MKPIDFFFTYKADLSVDVSFSTVAPIRVVFASVCS